MRSVRTCGILLSFVITCAVSAGTFPDAHEPPPPGWSGPVFRLSQAYPSALPPPEQYPWKKIDFKMQPEAYIRSVLAYGIEGNREVDWAVDKNATRPWFHAPWMHTGESGREFIRGMTRERNSRPSELAPTQTCVAQNWAVGMYNAPGGYIIGRVWADPDRPKSAAAKFPDGTMSIKLLFTDASVKSVPYLHDDVEWTANIDPAGPCDTSAPSGTRAPRTVRLLQVDVAVRDARADATTGWVFGTFVYDGDAVGATPWDRLVPVGVMWGNDPTLTPAASTGGAKPTETWINPNLRIPQHLGWLGRLNGPVDNPVSSCLSCHSVAEEPMISKMTPPAPATPTAKMRWFRNIAAGTAFDATAPEKPISTDYSLQLSNGIQNHAAAVAAVPTDVALFTATGRRIFRVSREGTLDEPDLSIPGNIGLVAAARAKPAGVAPAARTTKASFQESSSFHLAETATGGAVGVVLGIVGTAWYAARRNRAAGGDARR